MKPTLGFVLISGGVALAGLWTLGALGLWWLLHSGATALASQPPELSLQALSAWTERPWVRYWLDPLAAEALLDAGHWLLGLGGGPAAWLGSALALLAFVLLLVWAGGLLLAAAAAWAALALGRAALGWWRSDRIWPSSGRPAPCAPEGAPPAA